jgi:hypothetical protein
MTRHCLAVGVVLCLGVSSAAAQAPVLTINAASADIHKSPSIASPVIAQVIRGRQLPVTRELGDWVRVSWPGGPDDMGFVRLSMGTLGTPGTAIPNRASGTSANAAMNQSAARSTLGIREQVAAVDRAVYPVQQPLQQPLQQPVPLGYVDPPSHRMGIGGLMTGSTIGWGATGRFWSRGRLALQGEVARYSLTDTPTLGRVNSLQLAPGVLFSLRNQIDNAVWTRPYVGGGVKLSHSKLNVDGATALSENRTSWQVFGGSELTLPSAPRFALSGDVRYESSRAPFASYDFGGVGFLISAHWYVK